MDRQEMHAVICSPRRLKVAMGLIGACLAMYIVGPPLYWHLTEFSSSASSLRHISCPPCLCDCSPTPLLSLPPGLNSSFLTDCMKHDPNMTGEMEKNSANALAEELNLMEADALGKQRRADMALLEAKKMSSQYQKEADKCNSGMETCEEAREKAEAALEAQKEVTAMWELRARQKGWKVGPTKYRVRRPHVVTTSVDDI